MIRLPASERFPAPEQPPDRGGDARTGWDVAAAAPTLSAALLWRVHIPTVDESCIRVRCRQPAGSGPWPLTTALVELARLGVRPTERFRSLGTGRGRPLIHSQEAAWRGLPVHLESVVTSGGEVVEAALALPGMDEVVLCVDEDPWWELVDTFAAAVDATHGALVDGEPVDLTPAGTELGWRRRIGDHLGLLLPDGTKVEWGFTATVYATLPASGLAVILR
ncbi:MAG: hypothetical protein ABSE52_03245 [Candidatus Dormibacteria bacterium]|jgi:hypothetical protein